MASWRQGLEQQCPFQHSTDRRSEPWEDHSFLPPKLPTRLNRRWNQGETSKMKEMVMYLVVAGGEVADLMHDSKGAWGKGRELGVEHCRSKIFFGNWFLLEEINSEREKIIRKFTALTARNTAAAAGVAASGRVWVCLWLVGAWVQSLPAPQGRKIVTYLRSSSN